MLLLGVGDVVGGIGRALVIETAGALNAAQRTGERALANINAFGVLFFGGAAQAVFKIADADLAGIAAEGQVGGRVLLWDEAAAAVFGVFGGVNACRL